MACKTSVKETGHRVDKEHMMGSKKGAKVKAKGGKKRRR